MLINLGPATKALLAGLGAAATASTAAQQDGHVNGLEWVAIILGFVGGAVLTYFADNARVLGYAKTLSALITALAAGVFSALADGQGITGNEWLSLLVAAASAFTVSQAPNSVASDGDLGEDVEVDPNLIPEATADDPGRPPGPKHADLGNLD